MDYFLLEKLKVIDTDVNEAVRKLLVLLYNEAVSKEAEYKLEHNFKLKETNDQRLSTLLQDVEEEFGNAEKSGEIQLKGLEFDLKLALIRKSKPKLITPSYEFEVDPEYQKLQMQSLETSIEAIKQRMEILRKGIDNTAQRRKSEYENRKELLEEQNRRITLEMDRAMKIKEVLKYFNGIIDGNEKSVDKV